MNISEVQSPRLLNSGPRPESGTDPEQAAKNRELVKAVKTINEGEGVGPNSEVRFAIDRDTGQPLIRIVDRVTDEVIAQLPPENVLRTAEALKSLKSGERLA